MTILAVLQNQWFKDPERVRAYFQRRPQYRRAFSTRALFAGCYTGKVLVEWFKPHIGQIVWENASLEVGGVSSSVFKADIPHLRAILAELDPGLVLAFGKVAGDALTPLVDPQKLVKAPHPAARLKDRAYKDAFWYARERVIAYLGA